MMQGTKSFVVACALLVALKRPGLPGLAIAHPVDGDIAGTAGDPNKATDMIQKIAALLDAARHAADGDATTSSSSLAAAEPSSPEKAPPGSTGTSDTASAATASSTSAAEQQVKQATEIPARSTDPKEKDSPEEPLTGFTTALEDADSSSPADADSVKQLNSQIARIVSKLQALGVSARQKSSASDDAAVSDPREAAAETKPMKYLWEKRRGVEVSSKKESVSNTTSPVDVDSTPKDEAAEGETSEGETSEGETSEGETSEGETSEGETSEGEASKAGDESGDADSASRYMSGHHHHRRPRYPGHCKRGPGHGCSHRHGRHPNKPKRPNHNCGGGGTRGGDCDGPHETLRSADVPAAPDSSVFTGHPLCTSLNLTAVHLMLDSKAFPDAAPHSKQVGIPDPTQDPLLQHVLVLSGSPANCVMTNAEVEQMKSLVLDVYKTVMGGVLNDPTAQRRPQRLLRDERMLMTEQGAALVDTIKQLVAELQVKGTSAPLTEPFTAGAEDTSAQNTAAPTAESNSDSTTAQAADSSSDTTTMPQAGTNLRGSATSEEENKFVLPAVFQNSRATAVKQCTFFRMQRHIPGLGVNVDPECAAFADDFDYENVFKLLDCISSANVEY